MPSLAPLVLQSQEAALSDASIHQLDDLRRSNEANNSVLRDRLAKAIDLVTTTSTQINDRGSEDRIRYGKKRSRYLADGREEDEEGKREHKEYQDRVTTLTQKMDTRMRSLIDDKVWLEDVPGAIAHVVQKAGAAARVPRSTQATTQRTEDEMSLDDLQEQEGSQLPVQPDPSEAPTALLDAAFSTSHVKWQSKSLTDRYSGHNDYVGWYRMVYDAQHPGDEAPPLPHASLWFAEEENRDATTVPRGSQSLRQQRSRSNNTNIPGEDAAASDEDSEVEIAAERISIRCPITLVPFRDPLASSKCPHAFERSAILDMFKHTSEHFPFTPEEQAELSQISRTQDRSRRERQIRTPMVRCPECSVPLGETDLRPDPVLLRKVKRILERERMREEAEQRQHDSIMDADDDDEAPRGTQRRNIIHLGSSPPRSARRQSGRVIKGERASAAPRTQINEIDDDDE